MKIALVTTPWSSRSGIADYTRHLLPYLREGAQVDLYVEVGREGEECGGEVLRSVAELQPRAYDQILYQLGNEAQHAFMVPLVRGLGGTVMLHDWVLFDLSMSAHSALQRGGLRGATRAYQEGGVAQLCTWWKAKRRVQHAANGWFTGEESGRWSSGRAVLPVQGRSALRLALHVPDGREWSVVQGQSVLHSSAQAGDQACELKLDGNSQLPIELCVKGATAVRGDRRVLGVFLRSAEEQVEGCWRQMDLTRLSGVGDVGVSRSRFELPFNHSIIRHADAFLVHSDVLGERILVSRNAATPIARIHHGAEPRWLDTARHSARSEIGLSEEWNECFLLASFGALQAHKRPGVLLEALAQVRKGGVDVRLLCVGEDRPQEFDLRTAVDRLGLNNAVYVTGWMPEQDAWHALHAADLCVNLRGPSTGGTSGGACQALSMGRAVIVSDLPELSHIPGACVVRVPQDDRESDSLVREIKALQSDPSRLAELEQAARTTVTEELHWRHVAKRYLEVLTGFPRARASRRSLVVRFMHATARQG
ncbi:MAG: glycosyltransferase involved in cell wall biosynthesis [Candidatus Paceibacteria bacterium]|jgi:glycosyltransferase involved in cell wall biosynthesis